MDGAGLPSREFVPSRFGSFSLLVDRRNLVQWRVPENVHRVVWTGRSPSAQHENLHAAAHLPRHATEIGVTARPVDRNHQAVRLQLAA